MLSKLIIPLNGPIQPARHSIVMLALVGHVRPLDGAALRSGRIHGTSTG